MQHTEYKMNIAGIEHSLPLCPLNEELYIGAFVMFGQPRLTEACATALLKLAPEYDYLITAEAKGIPLCYEMARQNGDATYIVARKKPKLYMSDVFEVQVQSITTRGMQSLFLDRTEAEKMRGKRVLIIDDVISTGESLAAVEKLVAAAGGNVVGKMAVLAEGDAARREDIVFLKPLPIFDREGNPIA